MYGTVARLRLKPGMEERMQALSDEQTATAMPGFVGNYVYRMDNDPNEFYLVVIFDSKESYVANATSSEQHERFQQMMEMMAAEPEWHDGEIVAMWPHSS
jgi:heme-degrading monooxygenase HmoA